MAICVLIIGSACAIPTLGFGLLVLVAMISFTALFRKHPQEMFLGFSFFILTQDFFVVNIERFLDPRLALIFKYTDELFILFVFSLIVLRKFISGMGILDKKIIFSIFLLALIGTLSGLSNNVPFHIISFGGFIFLKGFLLYIIALNINFDEIIFRKYFRLMFYFGSFVLMIGFLEFLWPLKMQELLGMTGHASLFWKRELFFREGISRVKSIMSHPGLMGWFMAIATLCAFAFWYNFRKRVFLFLMLLFCLGILVSISRKPIVGVSLGIFCTLIFTRSEALVKLKIILIMIITFLLLVIVAPMFLDIFERVKKDYLYADPDKVARVALYYKGVEIARDNFPLGGGFGTFGGWISRIFYSPVYQQYHMSHIDGLTEDNPEYVADTFWPHVLGEVGILGLLTYLLTLWMLFKRSKILLSSSFPFIRTISLISILIFIEGLVESIAMPIFEDPRGLFFIFGLFGATHSFAKTSYEP